MNGPGALGLLVRLDIANARAFLRGAGRDPMFILALVLAVVGAIYGLRQVLALEAAHDLRQLFVMLAFAYVVASLYVWNAQGHLSRLTAGPFQPLVASRRRQAAWLALRSAAFAGLLLVLAVIATLTFDPLATPVLIADAVLGIMIGAGAVAAIGSMLSMAGSGRRGGGRLAEGAAAPKRMVLRPTSLMLTWAHLRRRIGPAPLYVVASGLLVLAGAAGALAKQNSGDAAGAGVVLAFSLAAAWLLSDIDLAVVRQAGHEAISLIRLGSIFVGPLLVVMVGVLAAAFAAGLGATIALVLTTLMMLGVMTYVVVLILNGLVLSPPAARMAAVVDVALAVALPLMVGVWGQVWIIGRIFMLILAARRLRWRDL